MRNFWKYLDPQRPEKYRQLLIERYSQWLRRIYDYKCELYEKYKFPTGYGAYITIACHTLHDYNMTYEKVCSLSSRFTQFKNFMGKLLETHKNCERWVESNKQWDFKKCPFIVTTYDGKTWLSYVSYETKSDYEVEAYGLFVDQGKILVEGKMTFLYDWCCFREMTDSEFEEMIQIYRIKLMEGKISIFETNRYCDQLQEEWEKYKENRDKE